MTLKVWILISIFLAMVAFVAIYIIYCFFEKLRKHQVIDFDILVVIGTIIVVVYLVKSIIDL
jgi:ABC-type maltose transport system permease subunit